MRLRTGLDVLEKKARRKEGEKKGKISSGVQSKHNITLSVMGPNFTRQ
jgi:hypothetical protein